MSRTLLMAIKGPREAELPIEAEPVIVDADGATIFLELDDGQLLAFNATELRTAIGLEVRKAA